MGRLVHWISVLGPGAYLLGRWLLFKREPSRNALVGTLIWTYVMLYVQYDGRQELSKDYQEACAYLKKFIADKDPDALDDPDLVDEWQACYRHTAEYLEEEADYRVDQRLNR